MISKNAKGEAYADESAKAPGQKSLGNPGPGTGLEHFSEMAKVDEKEMHNKSILNMKEEANHEHIKHISEGHSYRKQSHAVHPGKIDSVVGKKGGQ